MDKGNRIECKESRSTHALNDLEENDSEERVDLRSLLVCSGHFGLHASGELARGFEGAGDD